MALRKVACVGDPSARWCILTSLAMVLVLVARPLVVLTSFVAIAVGEWYHVQIRGWVQLALENGGSSGICYSDLVPLEEDIQVIVTEGFDG